MADMSALLEKNISIMLQKRLGIYQEPPKAPDTRTLKQRLADAEKRIQDLESANYGRAIESSGR